MKKLVERLHKEKHDCKITVRKPRFTKVGFGSALEVDESASKSALNSSLKLQNFK